jgi:TBC1 domain family protein 5
LKYGKWFSRTLNAREYAIAFSARAANVSGSFPEIGYFRDTDVQSQLTNILFLYSVLHPDIGYRQGMHELLAPLYYAVDCDSIPSDGSTLSESPMSEFLSRTWVAADAWALFVTIMNGVGSWYEWRDTIPSRHTPSSSPLVGHVELDVPNRQIDATPYVAPIVQTCERIQSRYLKNVDPSLCKSMQAATIEPQIYGM